MRYLGIDYGSKKIGVAISDELRQLAFPHTVFKNLSTSDAVKKISEICDKNKVSKIILGRPIGYKGNAQKILRQLEEFKLRLEDKTSLPVEYENEVLTTRQAERVTGRHKNLDASSAALILQTYLDKFHFLN
jgi:putative Holliday junction resolvase